MLSWPNDREECRASPNKVGGRLSITGRLALGSTHGTGRPGTGKVWRFFARRARDMRQVVPFAGFFEPPPTSLLKWLSRIQRASSMVAPLSGRCMHIALLLSRWPGMALLQCSVPYDKRSCDRDRPAKQKAHVLPRGEKRIDWRRTQQHANNASHLVARNTPDTIAFSAWGADGDGGDQE